MDDYRIPVYFMYSINGNLLVLVIVAAQHWNSLIFWDVTARVPTRRQTRKQAALVAPTAPYPT